MFTLVSGHVGKKRKGKETNLFLESISKNAEKIFIVGDLFDCWIEYRKVVPKGFYRTLAKLNEISESGIEVNFSPATMISG